jgi:hypothetical protein
MRTSFHHQPEAQHPNFQLSVSSPADYPIFGSKPVALEVSKYFPVYPRKRTYARQMS